MIQWLLMRDKNDDYTSNFSISCWSACIWGFNWEPSLVVMEHAITGLETPQARPRATIEIYLIILQVHKNK